MKSKAKTLVKAGAVLGVESATERIFRDTIVDEAKRAGWGSDFLNKKGERGIESMDYESIINELGKEFSKKKITKTAVKEFFGKKIQEGEKKLQKLESEEKEIVGNKTVRFFA